VLGIEARLLVLFELRTSLNPAVRKDHGTNFQIAVVQGTVEGQKVKHVVSKAPDGVLLASDNNRVVARKLSNEVDVEGLHEPGVRNGHSKVWVGCAERSEIVCIFNGAGGRRVKRAKRIRIEWNNIMLV